MAKIKLGPMVGQASGSVGGAVFSHNRYGTYMRRRATPTKVTSLPAMNAKALLAAISRGWQTLDPEEQLAWGVWAANNPIVDRLGDRQTLTGHAAYVRCNAVYNVINGSSKDTPPVLASPSGLVTASLEADIGSGDFQVTFTATPIGATNSCGVWGCIVESGGIRYIANKLRLIGYSDANTASPLINMTAAPALTLKDATEARLGTLTVGQIVFYQIAVVSRETGLVSLRLQCSATVISTP